MAAPIVLNRGGAAVTLSTRLVPATGDGAPAAIASLVARRRAQAASPLTFAVVFPHSIHDYLLRDWLARAGLDPDADVLLTVAPPPRMADLLADGVIEGFAAGEPWSAAAVAAGVGRVAVRSDEVWPDAPDKVLGVTEAWAEARPEILAGLIRALDRAAAWAQAAENRGELTRILAAPDHVGVAAELIGAGLDNIRFHGGGTNAPTDRDADWLLAQMVRWGQVEADMDTAHLARLVFRGDLYAAALRA
jgi:NitT/TauT family transport system ATP-binding protein/nitrate/nitrite transport system substrate-binding protein